MESQEIETVCHRRISFSFTKCDSQTVVSGVGVGSVFVLGVPAARRMCSPLIAFRNASRGPLSGFKRKGYTLVTIWRAKKKKKKMRSI